MRRRYSKPTMILTHKHYVSVRDSDWYEWECRATAANMSTSQYLMCAMRAYIRSKMDAALFQIDPETVKKEHH